MLGWFETLSISEWVATSDWGYPLLLSVHSMGMAIVVGLLVMLDLRVLGVARMLPISMFQRLTPLIWFGFGLNLVSGVMLFMSMSTRLAVNWPFLSKLGAVAVGGVLTWYLWRNIAIDLRHRALGEPVVASGSRGAATLPQFSLQTRLLAIASIAVWFVAILFGRLIAYVLDAAILSGEI